MDQVVSIELTGEPGRALQDRLSRYDQRIVSTACRRARVTSFWGNAALPAVLVVGGLDACPMSAVSGSSETAVFPESCRPVGLTLLALCCLVSRLFAIMYQVPRTTTAQCMARRGPQCLHVDLSSTVCCERTRGNTAQGCSPPSRMVAEHRDVTMQTGWQHSSAANHA